MKSFANSAIFSMAAFMCTSSDFIPEVSASECKGENLEFEIYEDDKCNKLSKLWTNRWKEQFDPKTIKDMNGCWPNDMMVHIECDNEGVTWSYWDRKHGPKAYKCEGEPDKVEVTKFDECVTDSHWWRGWGFMVKKAGGNNLASLQLPEEEVEPVVDHFLEIEENILV